MIIYCLSDIHGYYLPFEKALKLIIDKLDKHNTKLILLGDYIHGGGEEDKVLDKIMDLQSKYGKEKVIALLGNHEASVCEGMSSINMCKIYDDNDKYIKWMMSLPRYYTIDKTIFVHAGIDEEAEDMWKYGTADYIFTGKYPAKLGEFYEDYKIVAGHIGTAEISGDSNFHKIFYDGKSHYYIDSTIQDSGFLNILKVDTEKQKYYEVTEKGEVEIMPYIKIKSELTY